jgi:alkylation response protein AidB-like acyl-CoA dehydrogenase
VISFGISEEQEVIRDAMREFAEQEMRPLAREADEESSIPEAFLDAVWELGLSSTQIPEAQGGGGEERSPVTNVIIMEELAYGDATLALAAVAPSLFANAVVDQGSEEQKQQYLPAFCGEKYATGSLAVIEPGPFFDPMSLRTKAESKDQGFVLSGAKSFVPMADRASHFLVLARTNGELGAFIVPRDAQGLSISEKEKNLGLRALHTATLELERVEVPASARLGGEAGCDVRRILDNSRTALAAVMTGLSRAVIEHCVPYAKEREAFDEPIAKKQAIAFMLAEMHVGVESTRWLVWKAASQLEQGLDATRAAHFAREYAAERSMWISDEGVQVLGGHGYIRDNPVEMWFRNARTLGVLEGTVAV